MNNLSRRKFLKNAAAMAVSAGVLSSLTQKQAFASQLNDYKALVCVYFYGGLDSNDTLIPYDIGSYEQLLQHRLSLMDKYNINSANSSRRRENLLPISPLNAQTLNGLEFAFPAELTGIHELFQNQEMAVLGSVGTLIEPTTRAQFEGKSVKIPPHLFSHNDQQSTWLSLNPEGANIGWGGRMLDATLTKHSQLDPRFMALNLSRTSLFVTGQTTKSFKVSSNGSARVHALDTRHTIGSSDNYDAPRERLSAFLKNRSIESQNVFMRDFAQLQGNGIYNGALFDKEYSLGPQLTTIFPNTQLSEQLRAVSKTIAIRDNIGAKRQIFFVGIPGFDTHANQAVSMPVLHAHINDALIAFRNAMIEIGTWDKVTVFTASDFGRTLTSNSTGTDHGWGAHHFVMGGSVKGGRIYGTVPNLDTSSNYYTDRRGRLIPTTSVEQYASTLGRWFGLDHNELNIALPNLSNFNNYDLEFLA